MKFEHLTDCEELVMKTVWDSDEELSLMEVMSKVNDKYNKNWKPQTVSTFLARLVKKGYLKHYRQGRVFYYQILIPVAAYRGHMSSNFLGFWNHDNADEFLTGLMEERPLRKDEIDRIQKLLKGLK